MNLTLLIAGMAAITVFVKAIIFVLGDRLVLPPLLKQGLAFVPVAVLTAIVVPMVLAPHGKTLELTWHNPQLIGAIAAVAVSIATGRQLLTIILGLAVFFGWQMVLGA
jgi:branched-subunit amino acid transport protein